ncbi:MAG: hypothetical protein JO228_00705, partial [Xanthobacteraceae bacterium]|nr:hypothetical protein [Xanthobacteraceae bacterium]
MKQAVPYFGRFLSKLVLEIIPGALVSVLAAYLLSMLHLGAEPAAPQQSVTVLQNDGLSGDERRELTRQMLKERRENPEEPAEVKPVPSLRPPALPNETADLSGAVPHDLVAAPSAAAEAKLHIDPEAKPRAEPRAPMATIAPAATNAVPRPAVPRVKPEAAAALPPPVAAPAAPTVTASLPPVAGTPVPPGAPTPGAPTPLPQVTVNAPGSLAPAGDLAREPQQRGIVGNIFSGVSTIAGGAANITGNTVNWVIDLPGKAISAGGKLLTGSSSSPGPAPGATGNAAAGNAASGTAPGPANVTGSTGSPAAPAPPTP